METADPPSHKFHRREVGNIPDVSLSRTAEGKKRRQEYNKRYGDKIYIYVYICKVLKILSFPEREKNTDIKIESATIVEKVERIGVKNGSGGGESDSNVETELRDRRAVGR